MINVEKYLLGEGRDRIDRLDRLDKLDRLDRQDTYFSAMSPERDVAYFNARFAG
jgi:hypothetical protein